MTDAVQQLVARARRFLQYQKAPLSVVSDDVKDLCDLVEAGAALAAAVERIEDNAKAGMTLLALSAIQVIARDALAHYQRAVAAVRL